MNIYVGNISHQATETDVRNAFGTFGTVDKVNLIMDRMTGQPRGFGFVEMPNQSEGEAAINGLNGKDLVGRALNVSVARPKESGGGGRGDRGGYDR